MSGDGPDGFHVAVELESDEQTGSRDAADARRDDYFDHTSGRHHRQRVVLWRGEDALNQASIALGRQIDMIASQVRNQLSDDEATGHVVDSVELNFGVKVVADAGKAWGVFTVSGERAVQVKVTLKRSPSV
jgi:Trypsin-co-occurring domain 1